MSMEQSYDMKCHQISTILANASFFLNFEEKLNIVLLRLLGNFIKILVYLRLGTLVKKSISEL